MDIAQNINKPISYDLPYVVDIQLYKHNYYDNLIINRLRRDTDYELIEGNSKDSFVVTVDDFKSVLNHYFKRELQCARNLTQITLSDGANSIYFINKIFKSFDNLKYVKVNISYKREFSRLLQVDKNRTVINFDYKILTSVIDLRKYVSSDHELKLMNSFLVEIGLIETDTFNSGKAYYTINAGDLLLKVSVIEELFMEDSSFEETYVHTLNLLFDLIDQKSEQDNTKLIIITDYPE